MTTTAELYRRSCASRCSPQVLSRRGPRRRNHRRGAARRGHARLDRPGRSARALFTAGSALGALGVGQSAGVTAAAPGLALGYAVGALGSLGVVVAAALGSVLLLFLPLVVYGAGTATNLMARYAGADLASARAGAAAP